MAPRLPFQPSIAAKITDLPSPVDSRVEQTQTRKIGKSRQKFNEVTQVQDNNGSWAQVAQGSNITPSFQARNWFQSQLAEVQPSKVKYPLNHVLGIPQEIRDSILEHLRPVEEVVSTRPKTGYENYQVACRQTYHETSRRWNYQSTVLVPSNRAEEFIKRTFNTTVLHSNAYNNVKSLFFEIRHDAPTNFFCQMAQVLKISIQLEQLHLFGVGPDGYRVQTTSVGHSCGKHDMSIVPLKGRLHIDGQHYRKRLTLVNSIPWLQSLRVLMLDNLNMPLLQAHVLKNKPQLQKVYIAADPRTVLHAEYRNRADLGLNSLIWPVEGDMPPVKELRVDSNAIFTASQITAKVAGTLESLEWVIPDVLYQTHVRQISFYSEASLLLSRLHLEAKRLRELRICLHGPMSEDHSHYGNFMGSLKDCVSRIQFLQLVELHIHSKSPWFADEFIEALSPSVTRLYVTDLLVRRDIRQLCASISEKTTIYPDPTTELVDAVQIGDDLRRSDFISFNQSKLGFVGYEYDVNLQVEAAEKQDQDISMFLKLNGRLLDKERNQHLGSLAGKYIPAKEGTADRDVEDIESAPDDLCSAETSQEVENNQTELADCVLSDENEYFGNEFVAEVVFRHEPVARGGYYSYPVIVEVEDEFKLSNHWLSK